MHKLGLDSGTHHSETLFLCGSGLGISLKAGLLRLLHAFLPGLLAAFLLRHQATQALDFTPVLIELALQVFKALGHGLARVRRRLGMDHGAAPP